MHIENQGQDIVIQIAKNFKDIDVNLLKLKKLVKIICRRFAIDKKQNTRYEISIAIVGDAEIRRVNKQFLHHNCSTDCLSFDLSDGCASLTKIFELVVNAEKAVKEAELRGHSSEAELALYITHGLLHNFGFDDSVLTEAEKMHGTEDEILQQLGYGLIYNS